MNLSMKLGQRTWIFFAMSIFPIAMAIIYFGDYSSSRERELENGSARARSFSHMYAEQVSRSFAGVDLLVEELSKTFNEQEDWPTWPEHRGFELLHSHKPRYLPQLRDTAIYDANGLQRFHSSIYPTPKVNITDRPYFAALRGDAKRVLYGPFKGRNTGLMTYVLTRRIDKKDGSFAGVAFAALELAQFQSTCWNGKVEENLQAFLINAEGVIVAECKPPDEVIRGTTAIGQKLTSKFAQISAADWRKDGLSSKDNMLIAVQQVQGYAELKVVAILNKNAVLADWYADQRRQQLAFGLLMLAMLVSVLFITVQMRRQRRNEEKINELAFFDPLTQLPNRTLLLDRLQQCMSLGERQQVFGAVLFIDLDHFKVLNDTLGHDKGDILLQQVARRLESCVRKSDTVARLGGDEFVVVLSGLRQEAKEAAAQVQVVAEKILAALNQTITLGLQQYRSAASLGATMFVGQQTSIEDLLRQADLAMYQAKASGRNGFCFFDPQMQTVVVERANLADQLRIALQESQFLLHYQPQVDADGRIVGAEALVRWLHPQRGMVSPAEFIPMTEETGMILPLGAWVLETACAQLRQWQTQAEFAHLTIAVNVSVQQFRKADFVESVLAALQITQANPQRLKLELTESLLIDNVEGIIDKMNALKDIGVCFSLDDFGTGYSSLSYLKKLPLDQLKIDQSFVRDVLLDPNDAVIARTIVALAHSLGLGVIAEGVETAEQRDFLASVACFHYQGYYFSRPLPIKDFEQFVRSKLPA
jgi:diguanylate cyclase (GGDEF)-like protein